jgi:hypothetical protein
MADIQLYLKYFHGKSLEKALESVEGENQANEEGKSSAEHIDQMRN